MFTLTPELSLSTLMDDTALDLLAEGGVKSIAVPCTFFDLPDEAIISKNRSLLERGIKIDTCHLPFGSGNGQHSTCSEVSEVHEATIATWHHYLQRFELVGVRVTPMHTGGCMRRDMPERLRDNLRRTLDALVPSAKKAGTIIALENTFFHNPPPFQGMEGLMLGNQTYLDDQCDVLAEFVDSYANPFVQVCMDVGHSNYLGHQVMDDYRLLKGRIALFHLHDNNGLKDQHYAPGKGTVDFGALSGALRKDGYDLPMLVEVHADPDPERYARIWEASSCLETFAMANEAMGNI